ncbi:DUF3108 domain-containing protein [uncultured Massilia sp.]|uniref:DUF3108 domain-containing protein n=1 Tax=uncultured Massilia sp. TaxID=169973 RepID=UPI0025CFFD60|nr:DUF3108 domain-containing protein [uncultured Massilia sp.]
MKIAVPSRHRRLLALCAGSAALHLALLELIARQGAGTLAAVAPAERLVLRLAPPAGPASAPAPTPAAAPMPAPGPASARAAARAPSRARPAPSALPPSTASPAAPTAPTAPAPDPAPGSPGGPAQPAAAAPPTSLPTPAPPGRYRVRLPASAALAYRQTVQRPGAAPVDAGAAHLDWQTDGQHYLLRTDGVLGRLASEGARGDTGLLPERATEGGAESGAEGDAKGGADGGAAGALRTTFGHDAGRVRFDAGGADAQAMPGIQDRASLLVQLAGMGLASADQLQGTIVLPVADARTATLVVFQVVGVETLDTGLGPLPAWRLAQVAPPGQPRLDVWLAPDQDWLPVRLRLTREDGTVATQTVSAVARGPGAQP